MCVTIVYLYLCGWFTSFLPDNPATYENAPIAIQVIGRTQEEEAVIRKLDWRLLPLVFVLYSLAVLDRSNLGNARIAGMGMYCATFYESYDADADDFCSRFRCFFKCSLGPFFDQADS